MWILKCECRTSNAECDNMQDRFSLSIVFHLCIWILRRQWIVDCIVIQNSFTMNTNICTLSIEAQISAYNGIWEISSIFNICIHFWMINMSGLMSHIWTNLKCEVHLKNTFEPLLQSILYIQHSMQLNLIDFQKFNSTNKRWHKWDMK